MLPLKQKCCNLPYDGSASEKPKERLPKRKIPNPRKGEDTKKKKEKFPIKEWEKAKKERKFPIKDRKKTEEICRKVFGPDNI